MNLYLNGCGKYPAEQALLTFFPDERPEYCVALTDDNRCQIDVSEHNSRLVCTCLLVRGGEEYRSKAAVNLDKLTDEVTRERHLGRIVKLAFFRAALASGIPYPDWGCITGVRPVKLFMEYLRQGCTLRSARGRFSRDFFVSRTRADMCMHAAVASMKAEKGLEERDVCLYVGIPFCPTRCSYCSFVSQSVEKSMGLMEPYLDALEREIEAAAEAVRRTSRRPVAVYIGGGTPTTLTAGQLDRLLSRLEESFDLSAVRDYTVEAGRPDTITREKLETLKRHGVGRVSVNPQSMSDRVLEAIGRRHTAADVIEAVKLLKSVGGFGLNMDLIAGLPADTEADFAATLDAVLDLAPENITVHTLAMKRGSQLSRDGAELPGADEVGRMLSAAIRKLDGRSYAPYYLYRQKYMQGGFENVGWCLPGGESLYNICIMEELCGIISMGAGGSTKLVGPGGRMERFFAPKYPQEYIKGIEDIAANKERIVKFYGV